MKHCIFPFLLFVLLLDVSKTNAQQGATVTGSFKCHATGRLDPKQTNVNYIMTLSAAKDNLSIATNSDDKTFFSIDVLNAANNVLSHWSPESAGASCSH